MSLTVASKIFRAAVPSVYAGRPSVHLSPGSKILQIMKL